MPQFSLGSFILGIVIAIAVYHGYIVYKLNTLTITTANQVRVNDNRLTQIENFLNNAIARQQKNNINTKKQAPKQQIQEKKSNDKEEEK